MATANTPLTSVPADLLKRILVGIPLDDHRAATAACRAFRAVISGPQFPALRRNFGFGERGVVVINDTGDDVLTIRAAQQSRVLASISVSLYLNNCVTTDGGARLFFCTCSRNENIMSSTPKFILAVDASSRRWKRLTTLPLNQRSHCLEWHGGLLYVAGGIGTLGGEQGERRLDTLHTFNEATGVWEDLPSMPQAVTRSVSGVIGNELFIVGSEAHAVPTTLQIYDITTREWRFGAPVTYFFNSRNAVVVGEKLFVIELTGATMLVYDPQSDTWTDEELPVDRREGGDWVEHACAHKGQLVVFSRRGTAFVRSAEGSWSPFSYGPWAFEERNAAVRPFPRALSGSVILG